MDFEEENVEFEEEITDSENEDADLGEEDTDLEEEDMDLEEEDADPEEEIRGFAGEKRKRREAGRRSSMLPLFVTIGLLAFATMFGLLALLLRERSMKEEPACKYRYVSMSEEAAARAYVWLNRIEDMPLSYAEIKELMGDIRLELVLTPTEGGEGYEQTLAEGTYEACEKLARAGFEAAYREVLRHRFYAAGYEEEVSDDMLDDMMREAYGMSISEYLSFCQVQLLTGKEELYGLYTVEVADE